MIGGDLDQDDPDPVRVLDPHLDQPPWLGRGLPQHTGAGRSQPLMLGVDWPVLLLGFVAYAALAAVVVGVATRRAFRSDVAGRFAEAGT